MPPLAAGFAIDTSSWVDLARVGEVVLIAASTNPTVRKELRPARLEALYELAFLRMFLSWETYLEETLTRLICGYSLGTPGRTLSGDPFTLINAPFATLGAASAAILGGNPFVSWADPDKVIARSRRYVTDGPHETILTSARVNLGWYTDVRNRIAHPSESARRKFDLATMGVAGKRYPASSPGRFLRDRDPTTAERRLVLITRELTGLAGQITP